MKITKEEDYALVFMGLLAAQSPRLASLQEMAVNHAIPYSFLKQIARQLREAGLVRAKEGAAGGYSLAMPARQISVAAILEAIRGPLTLQTVEKGRRSLVTSLDTAPLTQASKAIRQVFDTISLAELAKSLSQKL